MNRLYVGSLPYNLDSDALRVLFEQHGHRVVRSWIVRDHATKRSRGFGFVELGPDTDAKRVIDTMDGVNLGSRRLVVSAAATPGLHRAKSASPGDQGGTARRRGRRM